MRFHLEESLEKSGLVMIFAASVICVASAPKRAGGQQGDGYERYTGLHDLDLKVEDFKSMEQTAGWDVARIETGKAFETSFEEENLFRFDDA